MVQILATKSDFDNIVSQDKLVVVDFTATWCPPCQAPMSHNQDMIIKYGS